MGNGGEKKDQYYYYWSLFVVPSISNQTLISTSTPLGSSNFIKASTVLVLVE